MRNVLLTGATGFLGGHVCLELLRRTGTGVHCLVRGKSGAGARRRLVERLAELGAEPELTRRVTTVHGDFTRPRFGLGAADYDALAERVDAVYHCGAWVSMVADRARLAPANVVGTEVAIAFARHGRPKHLHHVSTLAAFGSARAAGVGTIEESTAPKEEYACGIGYARSKLAAEQLVRAAGAAGLPVTVHRPGIILGDSRTGACPEGDVEVRLIRAAVETGLAPVCPGRFPAAPVDFVARAIVSLSQRPDAAGRTFHPVHPTPVATADIFAHARAFGYELSEVTLDEWDAALRERLALPSAFVVLALSEAISHLLGRTPGHLLPEVACAETTRALGETSPDLDRAHFFRIFRHLADAGRLPEPRAMTREPSAWSS
ncbi:oxidoreductase [Phytomonospora endophytica]|nr:oxidoreductase [Phytomonospora endophytica]